MKKLLTLLLAVGCLLSTSFTNVKALTDYDDGLDWDSIVSPNPGYSSWSTIKSGEAGEISITLYNREYATGWSTTFSDTVPGLWYKSGVKYSYEQAQYGTSQTAYYGDYQDWCVSAGYSTKTVTQDTGGNWYAKDTAGSTSQTISTTIDGSPGKVTEIMADIDVCRDGNDQYTQPAITYQCIDSSGKTSTIASFVATSDVNKNTSWSGSKKCSKVKIISAGDTGSGRNKTYFKFKVIASSTVEKFKCPTSFTETNKWRDTAYTTNKSKGIKPSSKVVYFSPTTWTNPVSKEQFASYKSDWSKDVPSTCRLVDSYCSNDSRLTSVTLYSYPMYSNPILMAEDAYYYVGDTVTKDDLLKKVHAYDTADGKLDNIQVISVVYEDGTIDTSNKDLDTSKVQDIIVNYKVANKVGLEVNAAQNVHILSSIKEDKSVGIYGRYYSCDYYDFLKKTYTQTNPGDATYKTIFKDEEYIRKMKKVCENDTSDTNTEVVNRNLKYKFNISFDLRDGTPVTNVNVQYNSKVLDSAPEIQDREGYKFKNWLDESGNIITENTKATKSQVYTADWDLTEYTIEYDLDGGYLPDDKTNPVTYNALADTFEIVNPVSKDLAFNGWTSTDLNIDKEMNVKIEKGKVNKNIKLVANWKDVSITCCELIEDTNTSVDTLANNLKIQSTAISLLKKVTDNWFNNKTIKLTFDSETIKENVKILNYRSEEVTNSFTVPIGSNIYIKTNIDTSKSKYKNTQIYLDDKLISDGSDSVLEKVLYKTFKITSDKVSEIEVTSDSKNVKIYLKK